MARRVWVLGLMGAAAVAAACGEGRAILNVDVLSFIGGGGNDTVHYHFTVNNQFPAPPLRVSLLRGLGNSTVQSVSLILGSSAVRSAGSGTLTYDVHFAGSSAALYSDTTCAPGSFCLKHSVTFSTVDSVAVPLDSIGLAADSIFGKDSIFVGVRVAGAPMVAPFDGRVRLSTVRLLIVLQDHIFH